MDEYIKREDAIKAITYNGLGDTTNIISLTLLTAQKGIRKIPAVDAVEVVRCKDCVSFTGEICSYHSDYYGDHEVMVEADDYCSYGRREW